MGITDTFRALKIITKAAKFVRTNEDKVNKVRELCQEICEAIQILQDKKDLVQEYLNKAHEILIRLRRLV